MIWTIAVGVALGMLLFYVLRWLLELAVAPLIVGAACIWVLFQEDGRQTYKACVIIFIGAVCFGALVGIDKIAPLATEYAKTTYRQMQMANGFPTFEDTKPVAKFD